MSWSDDGIEILAPSSLDALLDGLLGRYNDMSYVVRVWHAGRSILVPGDIEEPGWRRLLERGADLRADVLVASHHGRRSGYFEAAVQAISPTFVVVSTGPLAAAEDAHRLYRARAPPATSIRRGRTERSASASTTRAGSRSFPSGGHRPGCPRERRRSQRSSPSARRCRRRRRPRRSQGFSSNAGGGPCVSFGRAERASRGLATGLHRHLTVSIPTARSAKGPYRGLATSLRRACCRCVLRRCRPKMTAF
jgi:hypothetical protein